MERALMEQQAREDQATAAQRRAAVAQKGASVHQLSLTRGYRFVGRETSWRSFELRFVAYCGAFDSCLRDLLVLGESRDRHASSGVLITRQTLGQGPLPMDIGALDAKGKGKPEMEVTCYFCRMVGHRQADCWNWQAAHKEKDKDKDKEKQATKKDATPKKGVKKKAAAVDVCGTTHNEDWVMVDRGASVSACPVDYAPECEVNP